MRRWTQRNWDFSLNFCSSMLSTRICTVEVPYILASFASISDKFLPFYEVNLVLAASTTRDKTENTVISWEYEQKKMSKGLGISSILFFHFSYSEILSECLNLSSKLTLNLLKVSPYIFQKIETQISNLTMFQTAELIMCWEKCG